VSFTQVAQTPNQRAAAGGVESLGVGNPVFDAVLGLDSANALRAFDLLSGEIHASVKGVLVEDSRFARDAVLSRLRQFGPGVGTAPSIAAVEMATGDAGRALAYAPTGGRAHPLATAPGMRTGPVLTAWSQAFGGTGRTDGDGNAAAVSRDTGGFIAGIDMTSNEGSWRFGAAASYQHSALSVGDRSSSGGIDSHQLAAYAGTQQGPIGLRLGGAYAWNDISTTRTIVFPGFGETVQSNHHGSTAQVFGEAAYRVSLGNVALEPYAGLAHIVSEVGSMIETGGSAALAGDRSRFDVTFSTLGLRASVPLPFAGSNVTARGALGWRRAFDTTPVSTLAFASGGSPFTVAGAPLARDALTAEAGLDAQMTDRLSAGVSYSGQYAGSAYDHAVKGQFVYRF
jgi:outer membrane autotransporter protein